MIKIGDVVVVKMPGNFLDGQTAIITQIQENDEGDLDFFIKVEDLEFCLNKYEISKVDEISKKV